MELELSQLGTLDLEGLWVPYIDLHDEGFMPTRVNLGPEEYGFHSSIIIFGHGAVLPQTIRGLRGDGKKAIVVERGDRYYVYVTPP